MMQAAAVRCITWKRLFGWSGAGELMQVIDAPRFIEIPTFNFAEFAQILPLQKQPADGKYGGYKDKAEQPFFVCAVLAGAECQFITESHVDPHVRNQVPGAIDQPGMVRCSESIESTLFCQQRDWPQP
jgi:hypothetical protein